MISETEQAIITKLQNISGVKTIMSATGAIINIMDSVAGGGVDLPALCVLYTGSDFHQRESGAAVNAPHTMRFTVLYLSRQASKSSDIAAAYSAIESVRAKLIGQEINAADIWIEKEEMVGIETIPAIIYAMHYVFEVINYPIGG